MKSTFKLFGLAVAMLLPLLTQAQTPFYECTFEDDSDTIGWVLANSSSANQWYIDSAVASSGTKSLYISSDNGLSNSYNTSSSSVSYAYKPIQFTAGLYLLSYDWRCMGESNYDYLRVFLVPEDATLQPDVLPGGYTSTYNFTTAVPTGWICLNGTSQLNNVSTWQRKSADFIITQDTTFRLVFLWCSDGGGGSNPAAAVDSIVIDELYCPYPVNPSILNATANSFTLSWTDLADSYHWYIEIDSTGQAQGSNPIIDAYDTFYTFTGLTGNTLYTLHLATDCNGDTSVWNTFSFYTPCDAITTLPYFQNFETSNSGSTTSTSFVDCWDHLNNTTSSFGYPYVMGSSSASHNGGTRGLYWYSYGTTGPYKGAILPAVDTTYPVNTLQLSFWARPTSTSYVPEFVVGVVPNMLDIAGSFVPVDTVRITTGTEWVQVTVPFGSYRGPHGRLAVMAPLSASSWYAYTDEFTIDLIPECSNVSGITVARTGSASAYISWALDGGSIGEVSGYELQYDTLGATGYRFTDTVTTTSHLLSGLLPATDYRLRVRALCNLDTLSGAWDSIDFATGHLPCLIPSSQTDTIVYSTGTNSSSGVFVNSSWGNTFCESIYTAADLQNAGLSSGRITAITVGYNAVGSYEKEISIFMGNTNMNYFSSSTAMVDVTQLTEVCHAVPRPNNNSYVGWITYNFTTPFYWDGTSNIIIAFFVNQRGSDQMSSGFYAYSTATSPTRSGASVYRYKDNSPFTVSNQTASSSGTSSYLPSISFHASQCLQYSPCGAPLLLLSRNDLDTAIIDWGAGNTETSWNISYQADDDSTWTDINGVTSRQYIFTDLLPNTHYTVRVAPACGGDSVFSTVDFRTPCVPVMTLPLTEDFENFTAGSAAGSATTSCWNRICTYPSSYYPYLTTSYANSGTHSLYFYGTGSYMSALVLPNIGIPIDSLQVTFAAYKTSANYSITVGVMSDPNDFSTFVPVSTVSPSIVNDWQMFEVPFSSYTGNGHYIALACPTGATSYMYIDDITVGYIPSCPRPSDITLRNILTNTADVAWQGTGNDYIIEYGPYGFSHGNGMVITTMDDSTTLYGLTHSTRYQVYVRSICAVGDTSEWSFATVFTTPCDEIDSLPFIEKFLAWGVGSSARPACWTMGGYSSYPYIINLSTADSTYRALNMYTYSSSQVYASLPPLDSTILPINTTQVIFSAVGVNSPYYSRMLVVGVCTQPGNLSTFTPVDTIRLSSIVNTYEVAFDSVTTGGKYITFVSSTERGLSSNYVYLIDVRVESIPPCQVPNRIRTVNLAATSTDIQWNDRSGSSLWQVEYGPRGFALGTGTRATVAANPYTITGLTPSTTYDVYVRSICAVGDTSRWNRAPMRFNTRQMPAPVPYFYDFETPNEWENWQTCSNVPTNWYRDTAAGSGALDASGEYAIYISADSGATVSTGVDNVVNAVAYRDFDFGTDPFHTYQVSFRAKSGGTPYQGYDGLMMLHVDPNAPVEASGDNLNSPWGHPDSVERHFFIRCNGYWNTYSVNFDTLTGVHRFALYWFDQNRPEFVGAPAAVDDFRITSIECPHPAGVRAENVTISSADLTWVAPDATEYRVMIRNQSGASYALDTVVYTNRVHITDLSPANRYLVYVRRVCDSTTISSNSTAFTFMTLICNGGNETTLATNSAVTSNYLPLYTGSGYSYTQQLILANELTGSGEISALSFRYTGSTTMTEHTNCTISMGHTSKTAFGNDFVNPDSLTIVYTGTIRSEDDWGRLIFQTPFVYNGSDNIVIAIDDNSGRSSASSSAQHFAVDQLAAPLSVCYYSADDIVPTYSNLINYTGSRTTFNNRNKMIVEVCPPNNCIPPTLRTPLVRSNGVTLRWQNTSDRYAVSYRPLATASWVVDQVVVTDNRYDISRVTPYTDYIYRVRQYCDSTGLSHWSYGYFNSSDIPCLPPENLRVNNVTNSRVTLAWTPAENNVSYHLHVFNNAFDRMDTCYMSRSTVTGLEAGVTYYAAVRAECNGFDAPGEFSDTIQFTTPICPDASNLTVVDVYGNSAVLDWTPNGQETSWEILYGNRGFRIEQGISVMADDHPFTLTNLIGSTNYQAYIRTYCGANFPGEHWIGPVTFTTLYSSIDNVSDDSRVRLQPNPTRGDVTVSLPDGNGKTRVEVLDITGRNCMSITIPAGNNEYVLPTSKLTIGTYFLHITSDDINTVKKLVVH